MATEKTEKNGIAKRAVAIAAALTIVAALALWGLSNAHAASAEQAAPSRDGANAEQVDSNAGNASDSSAAASGAETSSCESCCG